MSLPPDRMGIDNEPVVEKLKRLMIGHNQLATQVTDFRAKHTLLLDTLMALFEDEIDDFKNKYQRKNMSIRIGNVVRARDIAHHRSDLATYEQCCGLLADIKKEAKEDKMQSLYNKSLRRAEREAKEIIAEKIVEVPDKPDAETGQSPDGE